MSSMILAAAACFDASRSSSASRSASMPVGGPEAGSAATTNGSGSVKPSLLRVLIKSSVTRSTALISSTFVFSSRSALFRTNRNWPSWPTSGARKSSWRVGSLYFTGSNTQMTASMWGSSSSTVARWSSAMLSRSGRSRSAIDDNDELSTIDEMPIDSRRARIVSSPDGAHAIGSFVCGRIGLVDAISSPARALSRLDLPDPVPPAIATTMAAPR